MSAAIEQKRLGIDTLIIEKGNVVQAIYNYPTHQTFFSSSEKLGIGDVPFIVEEHKPRRNQALVYYRAVAKYYDLDIRIEETVLEVTRHDDGFRLKTTKDTYQCRYLTIATGYYGQPNTLEVPGAELAKVHHYFKEAHPYFNKKVVIIGGKNSAVDAAIELEKAGAEVTVIYRGAAYSKSIKPWILPIFDSLVKNEKIEMHFNAHVEEITENIVIFSAEGNTYELENDDVFAMIGYHPDYSFLKAAGIELVTNDYGTAPYYDRETMETNVADLFIAGVIAAGNDANTIFIENGKFHGGLIAETINKRRAVTG